MSDVHLRTRLRDDDIAAFSALTATSATAVIGEHVMRGLLLADSPENSSVIVAERAERVLGFVHLATEHRDAWLVSGAVDPAHRRRGIGSSLLRAATAAARARGSTHLRISGRAPGYAVPGVDADRDPGTARFLEAHGAVPSRAALAMHRTLHDLGIKTRDDARPRGLTEGADRPRAGLDARRHDPQGDARSDRMLRRDEDLAVLYITHDLSSARRYSDEVLVMHHGRVVESGESAAVIDDPQNEYTKRLLAAAPNPAARLT